MAKFFEYWSPGAIFACYEWCLTPFYDKTNEEHRLIKKKIEEGDGLPDMASQEDVVNALRSVGFEVANYTARVFFLRIYVIFYTIL